MTTLLQEKQLQDLNYLDNGWILMQCGWLWRLTNMEIFNISSSEYDILKNFISRRDGTLGGPVFRTE